MKTKLILSILLSFVFCLLSSQIPQGFNYQAVIRNSAGEVLKDKPLKVTVAIKTALTGGTVFWEEYHNVASNNYGMVSFTVGSGTHISGTVASFDLIDWKSQPLYLKTTVEYPVGTVTEMGTAQILSVPYSLVAKDVEGPIEKLGIKGTESSVDSALFEVKNKYGNTVFAVYPEGVRVYVADGAKGKKGGFAVGSFGEGKAESQKYFVVSKDSVRIYLDSNPATKKAKGGFAVGGYDMSKSPDEEYLHVTRDSTRIYVKEVTGKGKKGGFAVGSFDASKGQDTITMFTSLTPDNYFIGHEAGMSNTTGLYNSFLGYKAGRSNTTGDWNVFIGNHAGAKNTSGEWNVFIGYNAGALNTTGSANVFLGDSTGGSNTTGRWNTFLGGWAGWQNTTGSTNVFVGAGAGEFNTTGNNNLEVGFCAGYKNIEGIDNTYIGNGAGGFNTRSSNVFLGHRAGMYSLTGSNNVYLGERSGELNSSGSNNIYIGNRAGRNETISNRLYIANSETDSPLIFGEFDNKRLVINGNSANNVFARTLFVNGDAGGSVPWTNDSDRKLKHDIKTIPEALQKVLKLRGVNFLWNDPVEGMDGLQMGFIGQEVVEIVPEVISVNNDHYSMQYAPITALLVEGMKEQQHQIEAQQKEINDLKILVNSLISILNNGSLEAHKTNP